jgi:hypothetical protein
MTGPRFTRRNQGSSHSYYLDGERIPGVTTVIGILDKPALVGWAAEQSASYAVENWEALAGLPLVERAKRIQNARFNTNRKAVVKGNRIHNLGEQLAHGRPVEVPLDIQPQVSAYARFLDAWELETVATETPVCSTEWSYGGTFDLIGHSPRFGTALMDIKTGKGVYSEVALQLNAYAACDLRLVSNEVVGPRGGVKVEWVEAPMVDVERLLVAHVLEDTVELVPVEFDAAIAEAFLHMLEIFETWTKRTSWDYRDEDTFSPPVGKPLYPEDVPAGVLV